MRQGRFLCLLSWTPKKEGRPPGRNPGTVFDKGRSFSEAQTALQRMNEDTANFPATLEVQGKVQSSRDWRQTKCSRKS
jgi:hypothetical protein